MHAVLESVAKSISREVSDLSEGSLQAHPEGNLRRWNRNQIVEHLTLSYRATSRILEGRLAKGRISRIQQRTPLQWVLQWMVLNFGYMPAGAPALEEIVPDGEGKADRGGMSLCQTLRTEMLAMDAALQSCREKFGMERVAPHPILGPLRVDQWRRYHVVHGKHHLKQLVRMRQEQEGVQVAAGRPSKIRLMEELQIPAQRSIS